VSIFVRQQDRTGQSIRQDVVAAGVELAAIVGIFLFAFNTRGMFGDTVRQTLIALSLLAGSLGAVAGGWVLLRAIQLQPYRLQRFALGGFMAAIGIYTVVHVL
jgi:hypothetical protein